MRIVFLALAGLLMAGCKVPPPPKPSPYRYMTLERVQQRSPSYFVPIHL